MSGHHNFGKLRDRLLADPEQRRKYEEEREAYDALLALHELRERLELSQAAVARELDVSQPYVSKLEKRGDMSLTTLASYLAVLGGRLEVRAVFDDHPQDNVALALPGTPRTRPSPSEAARGVS